MRTHLPKIEKPSHNSTCQKSNVKPVPYSELKNIRYHHTKLSHSGDLVSRTCSPLFWKTAVMQSLQWESKILNVKHLSTAKHLKYLFRDYICHILGRRLMQFGHREYYKCHLFAVTQPYTNNCNFQTSMRNVNKWIKHMSNQMMTRMYFRSITVQRSMWTGLHDCQT